MQGRSESVPARAAPVPRTAFREYALDGARLFFHPTTGTHVRVQTTATAGSRRQAPRVAMFGITNACNLRCSFCSRDISRPSLWTVESAAAALAGLANAGTLEVAFGGGEPFAFRGFAELVELLAHTTALAVHATTNGVLLDASTFAPFVGRLGIVRVSIYDDVTWPRVSRLFAQTHQRWGANILVDEASVSGLPARLAALADAGCHDVSLLAYVGEHRPLSAAARVRLAEVIHESPLPVRVSVCWGDQLPVARLFAGMDDDGDCGAGYDFVSITPDQQVQSCSFQDMGLPARTAEEILAAWGHHRSAFAAPSPRVGCARTGARGDHGSLPLISEFPQRPTRGSFPPIAVWQSFAGNNSGECVLVAKFDTAAEADRYISELLPGWNGGDGPYSAPWRALFEAEGVASPGVDVEFDRDSPQELIAIGATVVARGYAADDAFPELRALAWKRGAYVVPGGIHLHDDMTMVAVIHGRDRGDLEAMTAVASSFGARAEPHGDLLLVRIDPVPQGPSPPLAVIKNTIGAIAGDRRFAFEPYFYAMSDADWVAAKQRWNVDVERLPRLWVTFLGSELEACEAEATSFVQSLGNVACVRRGRYVLIERPPGRKRLAVLAYRRGATVEPLDEAELVVSGSVWIPPVPRQRGRKSPRRAIDVDAFEAGLRAALPRVSDFRIQRDREDYVRSTLVSMRTREPAACLRALQEVATSLEYSWNADLGEPDALGATLRRLRDR